MVLFPTNNSPGKAIFYGDVTATTPTLVHAPLQAAGVTVTATYYRIK